MASGHTTSDNARLAIQKFSSKVLKHLSEDGNVVSLPVSSEFLLALADVSAKGRAREELLQTLGFPDVDCLRTTFSQITLDPKVKLEVSSKAFLANGLQPSPEINTDAENVESIDFNNSAVAAENINAWAREKSHGKIQNVISAADIDGSKKMILLNAIYFHGEWWYPFNEKDTKDHPFYLNQYTAISIPTMFHNITSFPYGTNSFSKILKLPYSGESGLVIVLPNPSFGLKGAINQLAEGYDILSDISSLEYHRVEAAIPRFTIESEINLKPILQKLGINAIFQTGVDLVKGKRVAVSEIRQKSVIEVHEKGTEDATATCERYEKSAARQPPPVVFMADRPFVYILLGPGNLPLFIGVFRGPAGGDQAQKGL